MAEERYSSISYSSLQTECWFVRLPYEVFQMITGLLKTEDILSLSKTCRMFYKYMNNTEFWLHHILRQFPSSISQLYTSDLFQKHETIQTYNEIRHPGFVHTRVDNQLDYLAINSATHYNDEAVEKRHEKMYVSKEEFIDNLAFYQFNKPKNPREILFMKLIYFYLIDRKRYPAVDMDVTFGDSSMFMQDHDTDSLIGRVIHLRYAWSIDISGRFPYKIMPGKYEVSWRMKCNEFCYVGGETEFIVVPQYGRLLNYKILETDFNFLRFKYDTRWFVIKMGETIIYEPSSIFIAIRNWNGESMKVNLSLDCIELTLVA